MTRTPSGNNSADPAHSADPATSAAAGADQPTRRKRRGTRIAVLCILSVLVLVGATVTAGFVVVSTMAGNIPRLTVARLASTAGPATGGSGGGQTILITGAGFGPTGTSAPGTGAPEPSGLIMLLHINANKKAGGVVSLPPTAVVAVPKHGHLQLQQALALGGPSLLVQTVEQLTGVPINHYARIDFQHVSAVVDAVGGVYVNVPEADTSFSYTFHVGINHLDGVAALFYVRQKSLTETARVLRQQSLIRAILRKLASHQLLANPVTMFHVLSAVDSMLAVDSDFTNTQIESLALQLNTLSGSDGTFLTAPTETAGKQVIFNPQISSQLWLAIRYDSIAGFAEQYPVTLTPPAVP
jgi:LCP family protein required for cell wall assembly